MPNRKPAHYKRRNSKPSGLPSADGRKSIAAERKSIVGDSKSTGDERKSIAAEKKPGDEKKWIAEIIRRR